jgi:hypothetical protein
MVVLRGWTFSCERGTHTCNDVHGLFANQDRHHHLGGPMPLGMAPHVLSDPRK